MNIRIELRDRELRRALSDLVTAGTNLSPATREIAALLKRITEDAFEHEADPATGEAWKPLSDVAASRPPDGNRKGRRGRANKLQVSRGLLDSIVADYDQMTAVVGTNLAYATTQYFGAKKGEFGRGSFKTRKGSFPIPSGDIPARPFLGVSPVDETAITDIIANHLKRSFSG